MDQLGNLLKGMGGGNGMPPGIGNPPPGMGGGLPNMDELMKQLGGGNLPGDESATASQVIDKDVDQDIWDYINSKLLTEKVPTKVHASLNKYFPQLQESLADKDALQTHVKKLCNRLSEELLQQQEVLETAKRECSNAEEVYTKNEYPERRDEKRKAWEDAKKAYADAEELLQTTKAKSLMIINAIMLATYRPHLSASELAERQTAISIAQGDSDIVYHDMERLLSEEAYKKLLRSLGIIVSDDTGMMDIMKELISTLMAVLKNDDPRDKDRDDVDPEGYAAKKMLPGPKGLMATMMMCNILPSPALLGVFVIILVKGFINNISRAATQQNTAHNFPHTVERADTLHTAIDQAEDLLSTYEAKCPQDSLPAQYVKQFREDLAADQLHAKLSSAVQQYKENYAEMSDPSQQHSHSTSMMSMDQDDASQTKLPPPPKTPMADASPVVQVH